MKVTSHEDAEKALKTIGFYRLRGSRFTYMIILIRSIQMLECIMSKDIETDLECYKMWTSVSMGNILDVSRDCKTWQSIAL